MPFFTVLVNLPSASTVFASSSGYSSETFDSYLPFVYLAVGVFAGALAIVFLGRVLKNAFAHFFGGGRSDSSDVAAFAHREETVFLKDRT